MAVAAYPLAVHVYNAPRQDEIDTVEADDVNSLRVELVALETALGLFTGTTGTPIGTVLSGFFGTGVTTFKDAIKDVDTRAMHLAGVETVTGNKTFSGTVTFSGTDVLLAGLVAGDPTSTHTRLTASSLQAYSDATTGSQLSLNPIGGGVLVPNQFGVQGTATFSGEADFNGAFKVNTSRPQLKHNSTTGGIDILGSDTTEFFLRARASKLELVDGTYSSVLAYLDSSGSATFGQLVDVHGSPGAFRLFDGTGGAWQIQNNSHELDFANIEGSTVTRMRLSHADSYVRVYGAPPGIDFIDTGFGNDELLIRPFAGALQVLHNGTVVVQDISSLVQGIGTNVSLRYGQFTIVPNNTPVVNGTVSVYTGGPFLSTVFAVVCVPLAYTGNTAIIVNPTFINATGFGWHAELRNGGNLTTGNNTTCSYIAIGDR